MILHERGLQTAKINRRESVPEDKNAKINSRESKLIYNYTYSVHLVYMYMLQSLLCTCICISQFVFGNDPFLDRQVSAHIADPDQAAPSGLYSDQGLYGCYMSRIARKTVCGVAHQVRHKPGCTTTEDG